MFYELNKNEYFNFFRLSIHISLILSVMLLDQNNF